MFITKIFKAEVAHRVLKAYTQRCKENVHGHSYIFEVKLKDVCVNEAQMLIDFTKVKERIGDFLDAFDHSLVVWDKDTELKKIAPTINKRYIIVPYNPTAEMMACHIFAQARNAFPLRVASVTVWETTTGKAEYTEHDYNRKIIKVNLEKVVYSNQIIQEGVDKIK